MGSYLDDIRESVIIPEILTYYGVELWGNRCLCPIHGGDRQMSFSFTDKVFFCFNCGHKGSVLDLVAAIEGCDIYEAAAKLAVKYKIQKSDIGDHRRLLEKVERYKKIGATEFAEVSQDFELLPLQEWRGLSQSTINHFGLTITKEGAVHIPLYDMTGRMAGYTLRMSEGIEPKYKNATGVSGRSLLYGLYQNQNQIKEREEAIICEGQFDCLSLWDKGYKNVVAIMGSSMSVQQALTLMQYTGKIKLALDGDEAGRKGMNRIMNQFKNMFTMSVVNVPDGRDPGDLTSHQLKYLMIASAA